MAAARQCDECGTRHPVRQNEVWFESARAGGWAASVAGVLFCRGRMGCDAGARLANQLFASRATAGVQIHNPAGWRCQLWRHCWHSHALTLPVCPSLLTGFMQRTIHMFCCYKGVVYDMR